MKQELKRIDPLRAANVGALVYGLLASACVLLILIPMLLIFLIAGLFGGLRGASASPVELIPILLIYPVIGVVMGWVIGLLTSAFYNLVVRWSGGLLLEFDSTDADSSTETA